MGNSAANGTNGFRIKSWSDVVAIAALCAIFLGVITWGLKLEARNDALALRISAIEQRVADGILPRSEERIATNKSDIAENGDDIDKLRTRQEQHEQGAH